MHNLRDTLEQSQKRGVAAGHFNISDLVLLKAVFASARELNVPVLVCASEGEREFMGSPPNRGLGAKPARRIRFPDLS
jgi:fructose-bisphosphate aldolase class II